MQCSVNIVDVDMQREDGPHFLNLWFLKISDFFVIVLGLFNVRIL
jgi:hypothetical protein